MTSEVSQDADATASNPVAVGDAGEIAAVATADAPLEVGDGVEDATTDASGCGWWYR